MQEKAEGILLGSYVSFGEGILFETQVHKPSLGNENSHSPDLRSALPLQSPRVPRPRQALNNQNGGPTYWSKNDADKSWIAKNEEIIYEIMK